MTISEYISNFITNYVEGISISTNHLENGSDKYGLFKSPSRDMKFHIDGSYEISEYYQFYAKQDDISEENRVDSDKFLEDLTYWMDDFSTQYKYPSIDGGRTVTKIEITGCPYLIETVNNSESLYHMSLKITYEREEREV